MPTPENRAPLRRWRRWRLPPLPILAWAAAAAPILISGLAEGHDWLFELVRISQYRDALSAGTFPPAWAGDLYGGYGSPIFLFYAPLFLLGASGIAILTGSVLTGTEGMLLLVLAAGAGCLHKAASSALADAEPEIRQTAADIACCVYVLSPYLLANAYLRNANAELTALALAPAVFAGLETCRQKGRWGVPGLALAMALVILAHNLTALWVFASALLLAALLPPAPGVPRTKSLPGTLAALGLALGLSAFFWVPALSLRSWMRTGDLLIGKLDFHQQFPALPEIFLPGAFFAVGPLFPLLWLLGARQLTAPSGRRHLARLLAACGVLSLCLTQPFSAPLWEAIPFLPLFQFPWRWLGPFSLATALLAALAAAHWAKTLPRRGIEALVFLLCLLNAAPTLRSVRPLPEERRTSLEETLHPEGVRRLGARATVFDEYLPPGADPELWRRFPAWQGPLLAPLDHSLLTDSGHRIELELDLPEPTAIALRRWSFPGWEATAGGEPLEILDSPDGALAVVVPPGRSRLQISYTAPAVRPIAASISLISALLWLLLVLSPRFDSRINRRGPSPARDIPPAPLPHGSTSRVHPERDPTPDRRMPPGGDG